MTQSTFPHSLDKLLARAVYDLTADGFTYPARFLAEMQLLIWTRSFKNY